MYWITKKSISSTKEGLLQLSYYCKQLHKRENLPKLSLKKCSQYNPSTVIFFKNRSKRASPMANAYSSSWWNRVISGHVETSLPRAFTNTLSRMAMIIECPLLKILTILNSALAIKKLKTKKSSFSSLQNVENNGTAKTSMHGFKLLEG